MKLVHYLSLIFLLLVTSPTLLASVPVSIDTDGDGIEDSQDADDDGDGVADSQDAFPLDSRYSKDSDSDGLPDKWETANGLNPEDGSDASSDQDGDGLDAAREFSIGTFANRRDSDRDTLPDGWEVDNVRNPKLADYQVASADGYHTCALDDNGVQCWRGKEGLYGQTDVPDLRIDPDGDGFSNQNDADAFPLDATEWLDTDGDGIGDNSDVYPEFDIVRGYQFLQTTSASANITSLHVLNTSDREQSFRALMYDC